MKRKILETFIILLLVFCLCACNDAGTKIEANEDTFLVNLHVDCSEDVYGIHFEYYLDGTPAGGGLTGITDGSAIKAGDMFTKDFLSTDFPESPNLSQFQLELFVVDKNGDEYPCDSILNVAVEYGKTYDIWITGSYKDGFSSTQLS